MTAEAVFRKGSTTAPAGYFRWESAGLRWLAAAPGGAPVAEVLDVAATHIDLRRLVFANPDPLMAENLGAALARTHDAGAPAFGSPPEGWQGDGFLGPLSEPLPLRLRPSPTWGEAYSAQLLGTLAIGVDRGVYHRSDTALVEAIARRVELGEFDDGAPAARIHGDLWSGNVLWTPEGAVLIDPAAHGGHRETDLAMLALFGCPHLDWVVSGYLGQHRLDAQWRERVALHQLHPLMVHAVLFGGGYVRQSLEHARRYR
ncbi:MAG TPA: fructosamine kinase family protein [Pedococcus sp.]|uniref:fructosamine kinase family protein n=1 Tax=Pedococcus sp. TaxID=2860345 RepID=UPI002F91DA87